MRLIDWEQRLHDYIAGLADVEFGYDHETAPERRDCCVWGAGAVEAVTGDDPMAEFRGSYTTKATATQALKTIGKGTLVKTLDSKFKRVPPAFAQRGDLAMVRGMMGVVIGSDALFVGQEGERQGLVRFPRAEWSRAWRVD